MGNDVFITKMRQSKITTAMVFFLLPWFAFLGHEEDILEHLDTVQVSEKIEQSDLSKYLITFVFLCIFDSNRYYLFKNLI